MTPEKLLQKLPLITEWIDRLLAEHAGETRPVVDFGFTRLPQWYSPEWLQSAKVVSVARVPVPPLAALGLPEFAEFEQTGCAGITFKDTYFVQTAAANEESLHFHELVHVVQWAHLGAERFLLAYAEGLLAHGYRNSPLEAMAFDLERAFDEQADPINVESFVRTKLDKLYS